MCATCHEIRRRDPVATSWTAGGEPHRTAGHSRMRHLRAGSKGKRVIALQQLIEGREPLLFLVLLLIAASVANR